MESGSCSVLISLDISAAFDTIDIDLLLQRLESDFGIVCTASAWLRSYLIGRACYVAMGDCKSDVWTCDSGVPQGSVLGPLLFSAYVSPLSRILDQFGIKHHQYADDTQLYTEVRSTDPSQLQSLSDCVGALTYWFLSNGLQLNSSKSEAMIFGTRPGLRKLDRPESLFIGGDSIAVKDKLKILRSHLDPLLSMDDHVKETVRACNYHIRALRHVRKSLTLEATRMIVHGLVTARLDYCNALLLGTTKSNIAKLQHVQCDLARVVLQAPWRTSSKPLLEQLHWLPIQERVIFKVAVITFKTRLSKQPEYLSEIICDYEQTRNLRSEGQHLLHVPFLKSASARRAFCYAAPKIWNSLTLDTKSAASLGDFRSKLKTELFTAVYK